MTRVERGVIKRGKIGIHLWDYSTIVEWDHIKYLLTLDHIEVYKDVIDLWDKEILHMIKVYNCRMWWQSIYDN